MVVLCVTLVVLIGKEIVVVLYNPIPPFYNPESFLAIICVEQY